MEGKRFIHTIRLQNFLSYGSEGEEIELQPLNVLIGPNASGKSNLIEAIGLLKATPTDLTVPIRKGGGIREWLWKGEKEAPIADIEATLEYPQGVIPIRYRIDFTVAGQRLEILDEIIENENRNSQDEDNAGFFYRYRRDTPVGRFPKNKLISINRDYLIPDHSIISQRKDPLQYSELTYLGNQFSNICLYRDWHIGRNSESRRPSKQIYQNILS